MNPVLQHPKLQKALGEFGDREWRLDKLYFIRDERGNKVLFKRNEAQMAFDKAMALRNVLPKARKLGFSTFIAILIIDACVWRKNHLAGIIDRTMDDATDKLGIIKFAYDNLPAEVKAGNPLVRANEQYLEWKNGSSVSVGTSYRGGTPADLHISEYGKISVDNPEHAREIKTGAIQAVPSTGRIWVESTAHGTDGEFADMVKAAQAKALAGKALSAIEYKFHFFGWWIKPEYRIPNNLVIVTDSTRKYLKGVEAKIGRRIDADQAAWYQQKLEELGPDDIKEEFPSTADELFFVSKEGTFWRDEIARARRDKRIGGDMVPHDPTRPVNTFWDIGEDMTAIWFHQTDGVRHRCVDYWEMEGSSLQHAAGLLADKRRDRAFVYGKHYGPHDLENRDWANTGKTRYDTALALGIKFEVVRKVDDKADAIEAGRRFLNMLWVDQEHCDVGVKRIENYSKRWNKQLSQWTGEPVHNINSHAADSLMTGAMGLKPEKADRSEEGDRHRKNRDRPKRTAWSA